LNGIFFRLRLWQRRRSEVFAGIEICGHEEFLLCTKAALRLLHPARQFQEIVSHIAIIRQGTRSGMKAWGKQPTFVVGRRTWQHSALWYAGAIAHDAFHAKLYRDAKRENPATEPHANTWTGADAEKKCLAFQKETLRALNADAETIAYIEACAENPTYQGHNTGWRSWLDYLKRWW
jgi:hypothetical protein